MKLTISYSPPTLDNAGNSEIGLLLLASSRLPCLGISVILVVFQTSENAKDKRKALIIDLIKRSVTGTLALSAPFQCQGPN